MTGSTAAGTLDLTRTALRRDRLMTPLWVLAVGSLPLLTVPTYQDLYPDAAALAAFARTIQDNAGIEALIGRPAALDSIGGLVAWRLGMFGALMAGVMSMLLVVRHTRAEEETGRLELIAAGAVDRTATLRSGLIAALVADLALGVVVAAGCVALGLPAGGSIAYGLALAAAGAAFAGIAGLVAQLTVTGRAANGITSAVIGIAYLLRAVGDGSSAHWVTWLSPVGWTEQLRPYAGERWWVLLLSVALFAVTAGAALRIAGRRDLGSGLLPDRPGPAGAMPWLASAPALAWRLNRAATYGWALAYLVVAFALGGLAGSVDDLVGDNANTLQTVQKIGGSADPVNAYISTLMTFGAVVAGAFAVQVVLRMRAEETSGRAESVLAGSASRVSWAGSQAAVALLGPVLLMLAYGLGLGVMVALASAGTVTATLGAALVTVPAVWVVAGVAVLLVGVVPRAAPVAWGVVVLSMMITLFGPLADVGQAVLDVSPFSHVPKLPGASMNWTPMIWLTLVAAALLAAGLGRLRARDLG